jgi:hypothetical protein
LGTQEIYALDLEAPYPSFLLGTSHSNTPAPQEFTARQITSGKFSVGKTIGGVRKLQIRSGPTFHNYRSRNSDR